MSVYIIAEAGVNHNGSLNNAKKMVDAAKKADCDCIKFQTFKADNLVTPEAKKANYQIENMQSSESQYEMLKSLELSYDEFAEIKNYCEEVGIDFLSTPFDEDSVDLLENLGVSRYKIPSGELTNKPLVQYIAKCNKMILLSTGMATLEEVTECMEWIKEVSHGEVVLFHCTSNYPAPFDEVNMKSMLTLKDTFHVPVGYSDHTKGMEIAIMAVAMGATVIEKHFTLDRNLEGPDHKASLEPNELEAMVTSIRHVEMAFGDGVKEPTLSEHATRDVARKSLVYARDIEAGEVIKVGDLLCKRPGTGIQPKYGDTFINKITKKYCKKNSLVKYGDIKED